MDGIEASHVPLTDEEVRRARRAYLANVSYFDSKIGQIVQTLDEIAELENTVVIVTADHGDMLGERGLWYKMNFFEHSCKSSPGDGRARNNARKRRKRLFPGRHVAHLDRDRRGRRRDARRTD